MPDLSVLKLLLVENPILQSQILAALLTECGYQVILAPGGPDALQGLELPEFDLALIDLESGPGYDGCQAARDILAKADLPILFLTQQPDEAQFERARDLLAFGFLPRDSSRPLLQHTIKNACKLFQSQRAARQSEALFRSLYERSPIGIELYNSAGQLVQVNPVCLEIFGILDAREIRDFLLFDDPNLPEDQKAILRSGRGAHFQAPFDFDLITHKGLYKTSRSGKAWLDIQITPLGEGSLLPRGYLVQIQDVSSRKEIEEDLQKSEALYRLLAENVSDVIWILDLNTMQFRYVSPSVERLRGYTPEEVLQQDASAALTPASAAYMQEFLPHRIEKFMAGSPDHYIDEMEQPCRDGSTVWTEVTTQVQFNPQNNHFEVFGVSRDITIRRRVEEERRASLEKYRALFAAFPMGISISDRDGRLVEANGAAERILGISAETHNRRDIDGPEWQIIRPDGNPMPPSEYASLRALREHRLVENVVMGLQNPNGGTAWINVSAAPIHHEAYGVAVAYSDITVQRQVEQALRESEERNRVLFENEIYAVYILDPETCRFVDANPACLRLLGYTREEFMGITVDDISAEKEATLASIQDSLQQGPVFVPRRMLRRKDGGLIPAEIAGGPFDWHGKPRMFAIIHNISEREHDEAEIKRLLGEKELLLREVHHRIKNNMGTIASLLHLHANTLQDSAAAQALEDARGRVFSMMAVYERLYRSENYQQVNLRVYFKTLLDDIAQTWQLPGRQVTLIQEVEDINASTELIFPLGLILNEWVTNAFKHAFPAGQNNTIRVSLRRIGETLLVNVRDDGVGLPEGINVLESPSFGLRLVRLLTQQLGASLEVENHQGTSFSLRVPLPPLA